MTKENLPTSVSWAYRHPSKYSLKPFSQTSSEVLQRFRFANSVHFIGKYKTHCKLIAASKMHGVGEECQIEDGSRLPHVL